MSAFFEIDFLDVETAKSGDAITVRYQIDQEEFIHVVDGGFQQTGDAVVSHINEHYGRPNFIDHVVATHPDGDHAGGLRTVLESFTVGSLWMLRPWNYAAELINRFETYTSVDALKARLKKAFPNIAALEEIANEQRIQIRDPFQGAKIGAFTVLAPTKARYLDLVVESEKTPESVAETEKSVIDLLAASMARFAAKAANMIKAAWGVEVFATDDTSAENNMSVVQYALLCDKRILLTADAGRSALKEAADYAPYVGLQLPGVDRAQVPHHASRHNVSTEILDRWFGQRLSQQPAPGQTTFSAVISAARADEHHPRKAVVRAFMHRGASVITTEDGGKRTGHNAPNRIGWMAVDPVAYPQEQEE